MSKSVKDQTVKAFQVGGVVDPRTGVYQVPGTGITGFQQASGSTTGYTPNQPIQPYFQPTQFTQAQYQDPLQVTNIPTFGETVGSGFGQYDEEKIYVNDAGQILKIPFKDGRPLFPIPEGYSERGGAEPTEEAPTTTIGLTGQTKTGDTGGDREDTATVTPTTKAARNVAKGYSKGYAGLSTAFNSGNGGLSAAAAQAKKDFGITGQQTGNLGSLASFVMAASGVPIGLAALTAGKGGYLTDTPVTPGAVGTVSYDDLVAIANGTVPTRTEDLVSQQTAKNVIAAQQNYAVTLSGKIGYNTGDINPVTGTPVRNGMAVNSGFGPGPTTASYASVAHMKDVIERGNKAGWRGGYVSKDVYDNLSTKAKENYNNFDESHAFTDMGFDINDIDLDDYDARQAAEEGFGVEDIEDMEVTSGRPSRDNNDAGDDFDDDTPSTPSGPSFDDSAVGRDSGKEDNSGSGGGGGSEAGDPSGGAGEGSGTDCLTENMKVKLNGAIDFVTNIKVGDMIDGSVVKEVLHKHMRSGYFVINNELEITNDHPVLANGAWTKPEELYIGDYINDVKVESIKYIDRMTPTVSIVIDGDSFDVYTEGSTYTVHGRYREVRQQAA